MKRLDAAKKKNIPWKKWALSVPSHQGRGLNVPLPWWEREGRGDMVLLMNSF
jgi:hypothetical protein